MVSRMLVENHAYIHEQHELVNRFVSKVFPGYPVTFEGKIIHYNATLCPEYPFHVKYDDGDEEDISESEARRILVQGYCRPSRQHHYSQDPNSHTSRPSAEGCNSPDEGYPVSDLHHACPQNGRATKLTAPNGLPGQITLVRSPNGIKAAAVQLAELQQQQFQRQQQLQRPTEQQQHEQLPTEQQQSKKGQRSHRVRKAKVPAVATVIAESDVARVVQNAVDMSHNKDSNVPPRAQEVAGQAGNANLEECAAVQHKCPPEISKAKGLNAFMAAKLANAIGKGSANPSQDNHEVKGKKRQRQNSDDEDSVCTLSDTERDAGGDETSNAPSRGSDRAERGRGRGGRGGRAYRGGRGKGSRGASADSKALPHIPGVKKKRGRPSKADIAAREAFKASQDAAKAPAAVGKVAAEHGAVPVATADLDPPTQQSAYAAPAAAAAVTQNASKAAAVKAAAKKPTVATAAAELIGDASKLKPPSAKGRLGVGNAQKSGSAVAASIAADKHDLQRLGKRVSQPVEDDDHEEDDNSNMPDDTPVPVAASTSGASKKLKRLRKQPSGAQSEKAQDTQQALEDGDTALAQADMVHFQGSGLSREQPVSAGKPKHVEVFVDAVGLLLDPVDAGCARARPWLKHVQKAAEEAQAATEAIAKQTEVTDTSTAKPKSAAAAPATAAVAVTDPTAVAANQDSVGQAGSDGSGPAGVAEQSGQKEFHSKARSKEGRTNATEAQQPLQQDQHSQVQRQHAPRGSRTSPRSPPPMHAVQPKHADSRTGTSHPRGGTSHPADAPAARNANASRSRRTQHRQDDDKCEEAHASPSDGARSGDSSDNATVQLGVGHTGESSEALPASMKSSKPAVQLKRQQQQQQLHQPPTSSVSEQAIHSPAGNTKPGRVSGNTMAIVAAEAPESSSHTGKGALVAQNADAAAPAWFSQYMNLDHMHKQTQMEKLHNMDQNSQLVLNKMEDMQKQQGIVTRVGNTHSAMGGYTRGRKWRVEERHRFITAQLYPTSDDGGNYREQFQQVLHQLDGCLAEAGVDRRHVTEVRAHLQNLEKGQKQVCHVFEEWTSGLNPGPMLKFSSGKTGHEDVKLLMEASALVPASQQWRHPAQPMEIDNK